MSLKVTYVGDLLDKNEPGAGPAVISFGGETFEKGKAKSIPTDHPFAEQLKTNPTFHVEGFEQPERVEPTVPSEIDNLQSELTRRGVKYRANASLATLQELLADDQAKSVGDHGKADGGNDSSAIVG